MSIYAQGKTRYPQKTRDEAKALQAQGLTYTQIAQQLGISNDVIVRRWLDDEYRQKYNARALARYHGNS